MNRELELVRVLEPETAPPTDAARARQRTRLLELIDAEAPSPRRHRRRRFVLKALAATVALTAIGGGAAFAWSKTSTPDPKQAARFEQQRTSPGAEHVLTGRPTLDAEHVVCDYQHVGRTPGLVYSFASEFPLIEPLTEARLVEECRSGTDAVRAAPVAGPGLLCAVTPPGERFPVPAIAFAVATCRQAGLAPAPPTLLDQRNVMRRDEITIRAVGSECPNVAESIAWVRDQIAATGARLHLLATEQYPEGHCWLPQVQWGRGDVIISAEFNDGSPGTLPPP